MSPMRTTAAVLTTAAVAGGTLLIAPAAHADIERNGRCAGASYELNVDREGRHFEVDVDVDDARAASKWRVVLRHEGKVYFDQIRRADREGDLDIGRYRPNTAGKDTFQVTLRPVGGAPCSATVTTR